MGPAATVGEPRGDSLLPSIALPKGGGAIHGIGEKFSTNLATGTSSLTIPIAAAPGRSGFAPGLELTYDSGTGNGPFALGWRLSMPAITRKTDKGLPRYAEGDDSDVFVLSGAEDLVPVQVRDGEGTRLDTFNRGDYRVQRYRPRVEALFARIERWTNRATGDAHWRAITRDNVLSVYGRSAEARIADPEHPERVFSWLLEETRDDRGNLICYRYKTEDDAGIDPGTPSESSRFLWQGGSRRFLTTAQRYLKRIHYGNRAPVERDESAPVADADWLFEVVFDYGEHDEATPTPTEARAWSVRSDPFSTYRSTFEVRTYRLCRRVLMFHRFAELGPTPYLVRSTDFTYEESRVRSQDGAYDQGSVAIYLAGVTQAGYLRDPATGSYERATLPPVELGYVRPIVHDQLRIVERESLAGIAGGVEGTGAQWVDLDGEGIPGVLIPTEGAWYYKANLGDGHLGPPLLERSLPSPAELRGGARQLTDLGGDGNLDVVRYGPPLSGYFERTAERHWAPFVALRDVPNIDWNDPNLRFLDLDGDGLSDVLITENEAFVWYRSRAKEGFASAVNVPKPKHECDGPALVFADSTETIHLADMSGDGLVDIVRVRNNEVCYWPNLGYGRFGRKVMMDRSPCFDAPDQFAPNRIRFADIDGSGASDIIYLGRDGVCLYFNQSGNALSAPLRVTSLPPVDSLCSLSVVDLLGDGTACLVWSSPALAGAPRPLAYVDLMGGKKPHLLDSVVNNLGAETRITYAPSTRFYLDDKAAGRPWLTRLPFPVHVLERLEHIDHVTGSTLVSRYRYHHGFFDGYEREFRGFALVEQWDAESFVAGSPEHELDVPPVHTKTWFHTGAWLERERLERLLAEEYYRGDPSAPLLPDTLLPSGLSVREEREAARALRGQILRQETYADDGTPESVHPYVVSESSVTIRVLQRVTGSAHGVFHVRPQETITLHYERDPQDPRLLHEIVLDVDDYGNVLRSCSIAYPRRTPAEPEQARLWATVTERTVVNRPDEPDWYRIGVLAEETTSELTGLSPPESGTLTSDAVRAAVIAAAEIPFEADASGTVLQRRVISRERRVYYRDDLTGPLPLGTLESHALPFQSYRLAFTPGLLSQVYDTRIDDTVLTEGGYVSQGGLWWSPSSRAVFDPARFYLPVESIDPFGQHHRVTYETYSLLALDFEDPLHNHVTAGARDTADHVTTNGNDYRVLAPALVTDANLNRTASAFDALGFPVAIALMGKDGAGEGDTLADPTTRIEYDLHRWQTSGGTQPTFVHTFAREKHGPNNPRWQETYSYTDGFGREVMKKVQAEPGPVPATGQVNANPRWVGTGRVVFDNKGNPVKKYEPFFSATSDYETEAAVVEWGVTPILHYDPLNRLVRTDFPDGTYAKVIFDAWRQETWDPNDTVAGTPWLARMQAGTPADQRAATLSLAHASTPTLSHTDALGRTFLAIADNGPAGRLPTRTVLDIQDNPRRITDPRGVVVATGRPDLLGRALVSTSADAGEVRTLFDVAGKPIRSWNARGLRHHRIYDALQRATHLFVQPTDGPELLVSRTIYGEADPEAVGRNLRGKAYLVVDGAGVATTPRYDFHDNPLEATCRLAIEVHATPDWSVIASLDDLADIEAALTPLLEAETFSTRLRYDALGRITSKTTPDESETLPIYNEAGLLESVAARLRGTEELTTFVDDIDYNARGQREQIVHGNGTVTTYAYDDQTFRLIRLRTVRTTDGTVLQDLAYVYDAAGNIAQISDAVSFGNPDISADGLYTYDAIYQLVQAEGREHPGQQPTDADSELLRLDHPNDLQYLRRYRERYTYDPAGNILEMAHVPLGPGLPGWVRVYAYAADSNRLLATSASGDPPGILSNTYAYDAHGNMTAMPHLEEMRWDHADHLEAADRGGGGTVFFAYDAAGQRVRKVYEHGAFREEHIYFGDFELYRKRGLVTSDLTLERQTLHVMDDHRCVALIETKTVDTSVPAHVPSTRVRYQLDNQLGSSLLELDELGAVISYEEYFAFGGTSFRGADSSSEVSAKRYRYSGAERDEETGLYYCMARYYAAWVGRWTSCDPLGSIDGVNLFRYVRNNPLNREDPVGTESKPVERTNNYLELLRTTLEKHEHQSITTETLETEAPLYLNALLGGKGLWNTEVATDFVARVEIFGRETTKLTDFAPPGWEESDDDPAACFKLACAGADLTSTAGESATGGGGVMLYEAKKQRIKTDKTASELAIAQIRAHIDSGRAVVAGVNEPATSSVVDASKQPVTDHFVAIYGYETDFKGVVTALLAKDNAVSGTAEVRFNVKANGEITKPKENRPEGQEYLSQEYQLSEVRFNSALPYKGSLKPTNNAGKFMYWPNK